MHMIKYHRYHTVPYQTKYVAYIASYIASYIAAYIAAYIHTYIHTYIRIYGIIFKKKEKQHGPSKKQSQEYATVSFNPFHIIIGLVIFVAMSYVWVFLNLQPSDRCSDLSVSPFCFNFFHELKMKKIRWKSIFNYWRIFLFHSNITFRDRTGHFFKTIAILIVIYRDELWSFNRLNDELIIESIIESKLFDLFNRLIDESIIESKLFNWFFIHINLNDNKCFAFYYPIARYRIIPGEMIYYFYGD